MSVVLAARERTDLRKSALNELRKEGYVPAVVYGRDEETKPIAVKKGDLLKTISEVGRNGIFQLEVSGKPRSVVLGDFQTDPIQRDIIHADFLYVTEHTELNTKVNVSVTGEAPGVKEGGILQIVLHELEITAKPQDIPESIELDVSSLGINDSIKVEAIRDKYSKLDIHHDDEEAIVVILPPEKTDEEETVEEQETEDAESASK